MLGKTIGEGTFGKVKLAIHLPTGEKVISKACLGFTKTFNTASCANTAVQGQMYCASSQWVKQQQHEQQQQTQTKDANIHLLVKLTSPTGGGENTGEEQNKGASGRAARE